MKTRYFSWCQQGLPSKGFVKSSFFHKVKIVQMLFEKMNRLYSPQGAHDRQGRQGLVLAWILRNRTQWWQRRHAGDVAATALWGPCLLKFYRGGPAPPQIFRSSYNPDTNYRPESFHFLLRPQSIPSLHWHDLNFGVFTLDMHTALFSFGVTTYLNEK